jgi:hypothetical protein
MIKLSGAKYILHIFILFSLLIMLLGVLPVSPARAEAFTNPLPVGGDFVWAKGMGGEDMDNSNGIAVDSSGNVYTTGTFHGTADFDPSDGVFNLTSVGFGDDIFVSKLDSMGNFVWAKRFGGTESDSSESIAVDSNGNVYTTGYFQYTADFDPGIEVFNLTSAGNWDIFISKLDGNGNFIWAKNMGGPNYDSAFSIAIEAGSNVYTTGYFVGTADFDPGPGTFNLTSVGATFFICKLNSNGNFVWAKGMGGFSNNIAVDSSSNVYTTGQFSGTVDFDPGIGTANLTSMGDEDIFVSKLNSNGDFVWAKNMGGLLGDRGYSLTVDTSGSIYTTGYFRSTADFDPGANIFNLVSAGVEDVFISKLDINGNFSWAKSIGGSSMGECGKEIATDISNNVYTIGSFGGTVDFDPGTNVYNLTSGGYGDTFISKLSPNGDFIWAKSMGGNSGGADGDSIELSLNGFVYTTGTFGYTADFDPSPAAYNLTSAGGSDIFVSKLQADLFMDVPGIYWASTFIERLYNNGITGGCSASPLMYCPEATVTRAQMAVFLLVAKHGTGYTPPDASGLFNDVPTENGFAKWIEQLAAEGITGGCGNGNYCPNSPVTREQMTVFLLVAEHGNTYTPPAATGVFADVPVSNPFAPWIEALAAEGITGGCGGGNYCPKKTVTRAQMAVFLVAAFNLP